jgi:hypothetical protein
MPGSKPDLHRHRQIAELRASGMSYQAIGDGLGISHQRVYQILERSGTSHRVLIRCLKCKAVITKMRMFGDRKASTWHGGSPDTSLAHGPVILQSKSVSTWAADSSLDRSTIATVCFWRRGRYKRL